MTKILSLDEFKREHLRIEEQLRRYALTERGRSALNGNLLENLLRRSAMSLKATNPRARIAVAEAASAEFDDVLNRNQTAFFVTFAPRQFAMRARDVFSFDFRQIRMWAREQLDGIDHVGTIEAAYYTNWPRYFSEWNREPWIALHTHHLCWGVNEAKLRNIVDAVNARYMAFVTDLNAAHCKPWKRAGALSRVFYMLKAPLDEYRVYGGATNADGTIEAPTQKKRSLRPGDVVRLYRALGDRTMDDDVLCAGGEGFDVVERIIAHALESIRTEDRALERRLSALTSLPGRAA